MRRILVAAAVAVMLAAGTAEAGGPFGAVTGGTRVIENLSGYPVPSTTTRAQPVVGSVQRAGHFNNPFTHKAKYTKLMYNPLTGHFGRMKFRQ